MGSEEHAPLDQPRWGRGVRYALAAPAAVQGIRFVTKLLLAFLLAPGEFGAVSLAGLIVLVAAQIAIFGLDETLVALPRLDRALWGRMVALHRVGGAGAALATAALGLALAAGGSELSSYLLALAPMVWIANRSVLPTALLVRERRYRALLGVEVAATLALAIATLSLAALGAGAWSLVGGLHANALVMACGARRRARALVEALPDEGPLAPGAAARTARTGAELCGSSLLAFAGERIDALLVGFGLGPVALGLYELAQQLSTAALGAVQSLTERLLLPSLASEARERRLRAAFHDALAIVLAFLVPLHVALALFGGNLVELFYSGEYAPAALLLPPLALAAGLRCLELPALTALKASGASRTVVRLASLRFVLVAGAAVTTLPFGVKAVAAGVLAARAASMLVSLHAAARATGRGTEAEARGTLAAAAGLAAWLACVLPLELWFLAPHVQDPARRSVLGVVLALGLWFAARAVFEGRRFTGEWTLVRERTAGIFAGRRG